METVEKGDLLNMFFIFPMWDSETQRQAMAQCTPVGYSLQSIARATGAFGLLLLLSGCLYIVYRALAGFSWSAFSFFLYPLGVGFTAQILYLTGCWLAQRKKFDYDFDRRTASWEEDGKVVTFEWKPPEEGNRY